MSKNFEYYWEKWIKDNQKLWEQATGELKDEGEKTSFYKNAKALMSLILDRPANPMKENDVKEFNQKLSNTNGSFSDNFKNFSLKGTTNDIDFSINDEFNKLYLRVLSSNKYNNENRALLYSADRGADAIKNIMIEERNDRIEKLNMSNEQGNISKNIKISIDKLNDLIKKNITVLQSNWKKKFHTSSAPANFKVQSVNIKNYRIDVIVHDSSGIEGTIELKEYTDLIKKMWYNDYIPYMDKKIEDKTSHPMENEVIKKTDEDIKNDNVEKIKDINITIKISSQELSKFTLEWIEESKENIKEILNQISFYQDNKRKDAFIKEFKHHVEEKKVHYYTDTGNYLEEFGGIFGEIDAILRPFITIKEKSNISPKDLQINILGKETTENKKQIPADGSISFIYNNKQYICTFQSKNYLLNTLKQKLYKDAYFTLGFGDTLTPEEHRRNLYSYPKDILNDYGYTTIGIGIVSNKIRVKNGNYYEGAVPGLLRINSFVSSNEMYNRSDFYYFSGYYIPSCLFLKLLKEYLKKQTKMIEITQNKKNKNLVGKLSSSVNPYSILKTL